jgi:hypothetical protein
MHRRKIDSAMLWIEPSGVRSMFSLSLRAAAPGSRTLAAVLLAAALCSGPAAHAGVVTDCGDAQDATTTLRGVVASAPDNDLVDVSQCSTITLQHGAISTALGVTIQGRLDGSTTIDAGTNDRAFVDTGASTQLILKHLLIEHGRAPGADPNGGCVLATNQAILENSTLSDCAATSNDATAHGGAVNAGSVTLTSSVIIDSLASSANADAQGGAVYAGGLVSCTDSLLQNNSVLAGNTVQKSGSGGGIYANSMLLTRCAVAGNHASHTGGGIFGYFVFIDTSTVSENSADAAVGGIAVATLASITNSTIAFNHGNTCGGMLSTSGSTINSSILANNSATTASACHDVNSGFGAGTNNFVGVPDDGVTLPAGTYTGDPQLTPLGNHGGPTPTHALLQTSDAIDHGNDGNMSPTDQRGYPRKVNGIADIGAYERQLVDEEIFYSGME